MKQDTALSILQTGQNVFVTGSAGTGKTYLLNRYIRYLREHRVYPTVVAPTGIAASHLGGQTIHSYFALGIREAIDEGFVEYLREKKYLKSRFAKLDILIIDEISMVSPELFGSMDLILRGFKDSEMPFGGVQVVLSGDFFQLPPVSSTPREKRFAWQSPVWRELDLQTCYLEETFRQEDHRLIGLLNDIRSGTISPRTDALLKQRSDQSLPANTTPTRLYTHNVDVDRINLRELAQLPGQPKHYVCETRGSRKHIDKILKSSLVLEELTLKKGALVLCIKNNPEQGYVNGTTGIVEGFSAPGGMPIVRTTNGVRIILDREDWSLENDQGHVTATLSQIPLRLAWAITVHKSQGMTLDAAEIDLSKTFEPGQGYVALSRIRSIEGLYLLGLNPMALRVDPLILHVDQRIRTASEQAAERLSALTDKEIRNRAEQHIVFTGGTLDADAIASERHAIQSGKPTAAHATSTHMLTKELIPTSDTLEALAHKRGVTSGTILKHLQKIHKEDPGCDFSHYQPDAALMTRINTAINTIRARHNPEEISDDGLVRLKPIFEALDREVSYDTIRLCLMFIPPPKE